ncbi:MAG: dihydrolipoyl dehydrogenase family protein, partial [Candidatus Rokuibacteriota bacterium]
FKVLLAEDTGRILGAHLLGPNADEVINVFAVAVRLGIPAGDLKDVMFAYPTNGSDLPYML